MTALLCHDWLLAVLVLDSDNTTHRACSEELHILNAAQRNFHQLQRTIRQQKCTWGWACAQKTKQNRSYLLQVADSKCSGDVDLPLHTAIDDGVPIIQMLALDPPHLLHRPKFRLGEPTERIQLTHRFGHCLIVPAPFSAVFQLSKVVFFLKKNEMTRTNDDEFLLQRNQSQFEISHNSTSE